MVDTPEEAEYRAKVRKELEEKKEDAEKVRRLTQIMTEEKERVNRKPLGQQAFDFTKELIFGPKKKGK